MRDIDSAAITGALRETLTEWPDVALARFVRHGGRALDQEQPA